METWEDIKVVPSVVLDGIYIIKLSWDKVVHHNWVIWQIFPDPKNHIRLSLLHSLVVIKPTNNS